MIKKIFKFNFHFFGLSLISTYFSFPFLTSKSFEDYLVPAVSINEEPKVEPNIEQATGLANQNIEIKQEETKKTSKETKQEKPDIGKSTFKEHIKNIAILSAYVTAIVGIPFGLFILVDSQIQKNRGRFIPIKTMFSGSSAEPAKSRTPIKLSTVKTNNGLTNEQKNQIRNALNKKYPNPMTETSKK